MIRKILSLLRRESVSEVDLKRSALEFSRVGTPSVSRAASVLRDEPPESEHFAHLSALAASAVESGEFDKAIDLYDALISSNHTNADLHYKRANVLNRVGQWDAALTGYNQAIALERTHAHAHCNRGTVLERLGFTADALSSYELSLALDPSDHFAWNNRGSALKSMSRLDEALASYDKAIELNADYANAHIGRGEVLKNLRRYPEAIESFKHGLSIDPQRADAFDGLGFCLLGVGLIEACIASYTRSLALDPGRKYVFGMRRHAQMHICSWDGLPSDVAWLAEGLMKGHALAMPFTVLGLLDSAPLQRLAAEIWVREECAANETLGVLAPRERGDKIRIGYFSADFRAHPVALLIAELIELHDRTKFEIVAFAFGPQTTDPVRARLQKAFDQFIDVSHQSDHDVALLAREMAIDIAVDLGGFTTHSRTKIFAYRAAPIQVAYIGYLGSMGASYIDYIIADATLIPADQRQHYAEKIIYLPSYQANDSHRARPEPRSSRETLGLPNSGFVFGCCNANFKILPGMFESWMRILRRVPGSCLFLYVDNPIAQQNLRANASRCGIDMSRLVFGERLPFDAYLARFHAMDLFLDTLPYNAGTTASDALWMGLPVLTCLGQCFAGRMAASLPVAAGLQELIADSLERYEAKAVELATNAVSLSAVRKKLIENRRTSALFDSEAFTKNLEYGFLEAYGRHSLNLPPDHIYPRA